MGRVALPCIKCGRQLQNVFDDAENQPEGGVAFESEGHYGSTVWDPMNREFIEINVCDECVRSAAREGRVYLGRRVKPVLLDGMYVGTTPAYRAYTGFDPDSFKPERTGLNFEPDEFLEEMARAPGDKLYPEVSWTRRAYAEAARLAKERE